MYYATSATAVLEFIKGSLKPSRFRWLWHAHWTKHSLLRCCGRRQLTSVTGRRPAEVADRNSFNIHTPPRTKRIRGSKGRLYHWRDVTVWRNATRQKVEFVWSAACFSRLFSTNVKGLSVETFSCLFNSFLRENGSAICGSASRLGVGRKPEECWFDSRQGKRFKFFFFQSVQTGSEANIAAYCVRTGNLSPAVMRPVCEAGNSVRLRPRLNEVDQ